MLAGRMTYRPEDDQGTVGACPRNNSPAREPNS
jgi:hypothetical protein